MKTYNDLTPAQQEKALLLRLNQLLEFVLVGGMRFDDTKNENDLQARIDSAVTKASVMQTLWFAGEYIMEAAGEDLKGMAQADIENMIFLEEGEMAMYIPKV